MIPYCEKISSQIIINDSFLTQKATRVLNSLQFFCIVQKFILILHEFRLQRRHAIANFYASFDACCHIELHSESGFYYIYRRWRATELSEPSLWLRERLQRIVQIQLKSFIPGQSLLLG